jgi:cytoskeleton protein RodZ
MNDDGPAKEEDKVAEPLAGERLADARRGLEISVVEVAKALHLDEHKVVALEANNFDVVGPPVFAKGHMRKYAELVGVPIETVLADYYTLNRSVAAPPVVGPKREYSRELSLAPWIAGFVVLVIVGLVAWWWFSSSSSPAPAVGMAAPQARQSEPEPAAVEPIAAEPATDESTTIQLPIDESRLSNEATDETADAAAVTELIADPVPQDIPELTPASDYVPGENSVQLRMSYSGDCWTEVTDATGRHLFFDLGRSGRVINVSGEAPLRMLLGDSSNVRIEVNGTDYNLPPTSNADNTLSFTIDGM